MVTQVNPILLGELSGGTESNVLWCSSDGKIAFGWSNDSSGQINAVTWNPVGSPPQALGTLSPLLFGQSYVCSLDGSISGGDLGIQYEGGPAVPFHGVIWSGLIPTDLGIPSGYYGGFILHCVNTPTAETGWLWTGNTAGDGSGVFVGAVWTGSAWTELDLPATFTDVVPLRMARGLTDTVVGATYNHSAPGSPDSPVLWQGATATVLPLPSPATAAGNAQLITDNGTLAIGTAKDSSNNQYIVAWDLSGSPSASILNNGGESPAAGFVAAYLTPSGSKIFGNAFPASGFTGAAYWTSTTGAPTFLPALAGSALVYPIFFPRGLTNPFSNIISSDDGTIVTGFSDDGTNAYPVVWTNNTISNQLLLLPGVSYDFGDYNLIGAVFLSNDGSAAFGSVVDNTDANRAVYWPLTEIINPAPPTGACGMATAASVVLMWTPDPNNPSPNSYTLQYRQLGTTAWTTITGITGTSYTVVVSSGETIQWQVQAVYTSVTSAFSIIYACTSNVQLLFRQGVLGDYRNGNLYTFDPNNLTDNGVRRRWLRSWRALEKPVTEQTVRFSSVKVDLESGTTFTPAGTNPQCVLRWSDDGGHSWSNERIKSMGKTGETAAPVKFNRLGSTRRFSRNDRIFELSGSDLAKVAITGADVEVS